MRIASVAVLALVALSAAAAPAQHSVATVASLAGSAEVQRGGKGDWQPLAIGNPVLQGDVVRTASPGFAQLIFADDVVVDLGSATVLRVERYATGRGPRRSLLHLDQGTIEALVSGYGGETARFEVETPTAVARVQASDFIVRYDAAQRATDVIALDGIVSVQGTTGIIGPGVAVSANQITTVPADGFPSPAKPIEPAQLREYSQALQQIGPSSRDGLDKNNPIVLGRVVGPDDRPGVTVAAAPTPVTGPYLKPDVPGQTLLQTLSPDMRANTQPLPQYRRVKPNNSPQPLH
jgi:hypothetical protein